MPLTCMQLLVFPSQSSCPWTWLIECIFFSYIECPPPGPGNLTNGLVEGTGSVYRSTYHFACNDGYVLFGHDTVTCTENGTWNGTTPRCLKGNKLSTNVRLWSAFLLGTMYCFFPSVTYSHSAFLHKGDG